jgi:hypothetical protein
MGSHIYLTVPVNTKLQEPEYICYRQIMNCLRNLLHGMNSAYNNTRSVHVLQVYLNTDLFSALLHKHLIRSIKAASTLSRTDSNSEPSDSLACCRDVSSAGIEFTHAAWHSEPMQEFWDMSLKGLLILTRLKRGQSLRVVAALHTPCFGSVV